VKRQRPAVVVLDVMMPRLGGLEALRRIRAFHPEAKVVIVSGNLDDEVRRQALALGAAESSSAHSPVCASAFEQPEPGVRPGSP
jgi:DNA-binding NarL/FixJ family response regulator